MLVVAVGLPFEISAAVATVITVGAVIFASAAIHAVVDIVVQEYRNHHVVYTDSSGTRNNEENAIPYGNLDNPKSVAPGKPFTRAQKKKIIEANKARNGGKVKSDASEDMHSDELVKPKRSIRGVTPPTNEWQIDHIVP